MFCNWGSIGGGAGGRGVAGLAAPAAGAGLAAVGAAAAPAAFVVAAGCAPEGAGAGLGACAGPAGLTCAQSKGIVKNKADMDIAGGAPLWIYVLGIVLGPRSRALRGPVRR